MFGEEEELDGADIDIEELREAVREQVTFAMFQS